MYPNSIKLDVDGEGKIVMEKRRKRRKGKMMARISKEAVKKRK